MIAFDPHGCINCRICEYVCSHHFTGVFKPATAAIRLERIGKFGPISARACNLCDGIAGGPVCVSLCPTDALRLDEAGNGLGQVVKFDRDLCVACQACVDGCPQGAVAYDEDGDFYNICDLCSGDPACVDWCPEKVLWVADVASEAA